MTVQKRKVSYQWLLREVMAEHKLYATTELVPLLAQRGIELSVSQVHRLVTSPPERLSMPVLAALCDIFGVDPARLIVTDAVDVGVRKLAASDRPSRAAATAAAPLRPRRARVLPEK